MKNCAGGAGSSTCRGSAGFELMQPCVCEEAAAAKLVEAFLLLTYFVCSKVIGKCLLCKQLGLLKMLLHSCGLLQLCHRGDYFSQKVKQIHVITLQCSPGRGKKKEKKIVQVCLNGLNR